MRREIIEILMAAIAIAVGLPRNGPRYPQGDFCGDSKKKPGPL